MPLVRLEVRNAFGGGQPPSEHSGEDPKAVLDGLAVSGLVGVLRQLGDLADFAAEVFHGLQEEVIRTSCRSHSLGARLHRVEAALPPLERLVLSQTSHLHFAYTPGSEWHPRFGSQNYDFGGNDLPRFIMDSYDECRPPPRFHLLDKFDAGGAGSCLKRYSDPTFFKRVSSDESSSERHTKSRRNKKKRSSKHGVASVSSSRNFSFVPPTVDGQSSPSQTASTVNPGPKFDPGNNLNSFNSRIESGYIDCVFRPGSSVQADPKDSPCFKAVRRSDASGSASPDERAALVDDIFPRTSLQDQMTSTSSCVTWDEKAEVMEPKSQENAVDRTLHTYQNVEAHGCGDANSPVLRQMETLRDEDDVHESLSSQNDEIDSEPDNFMDALNTIELEPENERGLGRLQTEDGTVGMDELTVPCSDPPPPPTFESHSDSIVSSNKEVLPELPDSSLSESFGPEEILASEFSSDRQLAADVPNPHCSESLTFEKDRDFSAAIARSSSDDPEFESVVAEISTRPTGIQDWSRDKDASDVRELRESPTDLSTNSSVRIWTNGGLLGLMPSKPPDFTMGSPVIRDSMNCSQPNIVSPLVSTYGNPSGSHMQNGINSPKENDLKENSERRSTEIERGHDESSSLVFGLSRRLLSNSFGRKASDLDDLRQRNERFGAPETDFKEQFEYGSAAISPTASPPLEHMKISFHPRDGSEASKLKLKFSDGKQSHERIRDMFPSFQLIPDASIRQRDYGSDSDDDTFCRSSPFMSDDCHSRHSESNSEQWECGEANEDQDNGIYDAICGISSMSLVQRSLELEGIPSRNKGTNSGTDTECLIQNPILDLPSFDAVKPTVHQEANDDTGDHGDSSPLPPPLPPMEWRASKPHSDAVEDTPNVASEAFKQALGLKVTSFATPQQPKPAPEVIQHTNSEPAIKPIVKEDEQRSNRQREFDDSQNGKGTDDFLQQIRSKSLSLRRTVTEKPIIASGPTANVNVTAILEKANAIRQAVGSDGEDDTWSDT